MAHIVSSIQFVQEFKRRLQCGQSISRSVEEICENKSDPFFFKVQLWVAYYKKGQKNKVKFDTDYQKTLLQVMGKGFEGGAIIEHLEILEQEMLKEFERQWKAYLDSLSFRLMIPLLLCFFPAYLILLFGPFVMQFLKEIGT